MKFTTDVNTLRDALSIVTMAIPSRPSTQVLEGVLIKAQNDSVIFTASDSIITVSNKINGDILNAGDGVIRGKMFSDIAKKMPDGEISISSDSNARFVVRGGQAKYNIAGIDAGQYPQRDNEKAVKSIEIPQSMLYDMIDKTEQCIANDASRPILAGGCLEYVQGRVSMTALDGFRLSTMQCLCSPSEQEIQAIIPHKALSMLKRFLNATSDEPIILSFTGTAMSVDIGTIEMHTVLINGPYIKWQTLIPKGFNTYISVNSDAFRDAIERAALIARGGENRLVKLSISENSLAITSRTSEDEVVERLEVEQSGPDIEISFNITYLSDMSRVLKSEKMQLNFTTSTSPCVVKPSDDESCIWLILPVRTTA